MRLWFACVMIEVYHLPDPPHIVNVFFSHPRKLSKHFDGLHFFEVIHLVLDSEDFLQIICLFFLAKMVNLTSLLVILGCTLASASRFANSIPQEISQRATHNGGGWALSQAVCPPASNLIKCGYGCCPSTFTCVSDSGADWACCAPSKSFAATGGIKG